MPDIERIFGARKTSPIIAQTLAKILNSLIIASNTLLSLTQRKLKYRKLMITFVFTEKKKN
jgi:hypothetical protein